MTHDELLAKINKIIAFEAPRPIKENIWEIGGYLSALALREVIKLHKPDENNQCPECEYYYIDEIKYCDYPCPTIEAIEKELG